jgi:hypothetical protein
MKAAHTGIMSLATLNAHEQWQPFSSPSLTKKKQQALGEAFERLCLHVIHFQEVWSYGFLRALQKNLPSYRYVGVPGLFGPQAGLVTFSRFPLASVRFVDFPPVGEPSKKKLHNRLKRALKRKGVLVAHLAKHNLVLCNCHLVANGDGDWSQTSRYYHAHEYDITALSTLIHDLIQQNTLLICGDFNIPKWCELYHRFVDLSQAIDVFGKDNTPTFREEYLPVGQKAHCIDYIFVRSAAQGLYASQTAVLFREKITIDGQQVSLSDHLGLMADVGGVALADPPEPHRGSWSFKQPHIASETGNSSIRGKFKKKPIFLPKWPFNENI